MQQLSNDILSIQIAPLGAELKRVYHKQYQLDYIWSGDPAYWGKTSPVLFPIVGGLKNNQYRHKGKNYSLGRHGFAREKVFSIEQATQESITYLLTSSAETEAVYPFSFAFRITYTLQHDELTIGYIISNTGDAPMHFSVGAHPAFAVPITDDTDYTDYFLAFNREENAGKWPLSAEGLIEKESIPFFDATEELPLEKSLFSKDALVFTDLKSDRIALRNRKNTHGLEVYFPGFPFMGIWSTKNADFVCIEPWCGLADSTDATGELKDKKGIHDLAPEAVFERSWSVRFF
jgi:galactose mutarotase-like enzyme